MTSRKHAEDSTFTVESHLCLVVDGYNSHRETLIGHYDIERLAVYLDIQQRTFPDAAVYVKFVPEVIHLTCGQCHDIYEECA